MKIKSHIICPAAVIFILLTSLVIGVLPDNITGLNDNPYLSVVIIQLIIYAIPALLMVIIRGGGVKEKLRLRMPPLSSVILMVTSLLVLITGSCLIEFASVSLFPNAEQTSYVVKYADFAMNSGFFDGLYIFVAFALLPAISEEVLFRGIIMSEYGEYGIFISVFMSSLLFSLAHGNAAKIPVYLFCALVLAVITYATRSVITSIIVHMLYNMFVLFFDDYLLTLAAKHNIGSSLLIIILAGVFMICAVVSTFEISSLYRRYCEDNEESRYLPKRKQKLSSSLSSSILSPAFILLAVVFIVMEIFRL